MARKTVERNISFDDVRGLYYANMDLGRDEAGRRLKQYRTYPTLTAARSGLRDFRAHKEQKTLSPHHQMTLSQWLEYWMDTIVRPNRAETTVYAYQKIIDNHLEPALGNTPLDLASATLPCRTGQVRLSAKEFDIMRFLFQAGERNLSKEVILARVWGYDSDAVENHVEVYIGFLRKKLSSIGSNIRIETVRRLGYHLEVAEE